MRKSRAWLAVVVAANLAACVPQAAKLKKNHSYNVEAAKRIKTVAVLPFFNANALSAEDPSYKGKYHEAFATNNVYQALKEQGRYQPVSMEKVFAALKAEGFKGMGMKKGEDVSVMKSIFNPNKYRISMSMHQAMKAGKKTGADGLLIGSIGLVGLAAKAKYVMALRLVDAKTGKVVWGAAKAEPMKVSIFHPIKSQQKQQIAMAKTLISGAP